MDSTVVCTAELRGESRVEIIGFDSMLSFADVNHWFFWLFSAKELLLAFCLDCFTLQQTRELLVSQSALCYVLVILKLGRNFRLLSIRSSLPVVWPRMHQRRSLTFLCAEKVICQTKFVDWGYNSSSKRCPLSLHVPKPKWPRQSGYASWSFPTRALKLLRMIRLSYLQYCRL